MRGRHRHGCRGQRTDRLPSPEGPQERRAVTTLLEAFAPAAVASGELEHQIPGLTDADAILERMARELTGQYPTLSPDLVTHTIRESYAALARGAGVRAHLVCLLYTSDAADE